MTAHLIFVVNPMYVLKSNYGAQCIWLFHSMLSTQYLCILACYVDGNGNLLTRCGKPTAHKNGQPRGICCSGLLKTPFCTLVISCFLLSEHVYFQLSRVLQLSSLSLFQFLAASHVLRVLSSWRATGWHSRGDQFDGNDQSSRYSRSVKRGPAGRVWSFGACLCLRTPMSNNWKQEFWKFLQDDQLEALPVS